MQNDNKNPFKPVAPEPQPFVAPGNDSSAVPSSEPITTEPMADTAAVPPVKPVKPGMTLDGFSTAPAGTDDLTDSSTGADNHEDLSNHPLYNNVNNDSPTEVDANYESAPADSQVDDNLFDSAPSVDDRIAALANIEDAPGDTTTPAGKGSKKMLVALIIFIILAIGGIAATAYFYYKTSDLNQQLDESRNIAANIEQQSNSQGTATARTEQQFSALQDKVAELTKSNEDLTKKNTELEESAKKLTEENTKINNQIKTNTDLQTRVNELLKRIESGATISIPPQSAP